MTHENDFTPTLDFKSTLHRARQRLLQMHYESGVGHIGGNLSCLDILLTLYHQVLGADDKFVLSKGHAAGALYVALWSVGRLTDEDLKQFHKDGTRLSGHPAPNSLPDIPFATGSLGHGLSLAAGLALAKQLKREPGRVYCLLSDGEWQEGSVWEALIFAAHHRLPLTLIVDKNGLQGFGSTKDVSGLDTFTDKFRAFGVPTEEIDGHDTEAIASACRAHPAGVQALVASTQKGSRVSFMAGKMEWHYLPLTEELYQQALEDIVG